MLYRFIKMAKIVSIPYKLFNKKSSLNLLNSSLPPRLFFFSSCYQQHKNVLFWLLFIVIVRKRKELNLYVCKPEHNTVKIIILISLLNKTIHSLLIFLSVSSHKSHTRREVFCYLFFFFANEFDVNNLQS
jgi:hypothetical protein